MNSTATQQTLESQIQFVRHNVDNHQALIRFADTKTAAYLTLLIFLGASSLPIAKDAVPKLRFINCWQASATALYLLSCLFFVVGLFWTLFLAYLVVRPRGARFYKSVQRGHELFFFAHVTMHLSPDDYYTAVSNANLELLLRNLTDQVFELAKICQEKMQYVNSARFPMFMAFCSWVLSIGLGLWLSR